MEKDLGIEISDILELPRLLDNKDELLICKLAARDFAEEKSAVIGNGSAGCDVEEAKIVLQEIVDEIADMYKERSGVHLMRKSNMDIIHAKLLRPYTFKEDDEELDYDGRELGGLPDETRQKEALVVFKARIWKVIDEVVRERRLDIFVSAIDQMKRDNMRRCIDAVPDFYM